jgi:hypothetical protein
MDLQEEYTSVIENGFIEIHTKQNEESSSLHDYNYGITQEDESFGILNIKMKKTRITKIPTLFLLTIDKTGSMNEIGKGKTPKIDYVIQTVKNIIRYLSSQKVPIYVRIHIFNEEVEVLLEETIITQENVEEIIEKVNSITCESCTNIGNALLKANETLIEYSKKNPTHNIAHIFMTDGEPTIGETNSDKLKEFVNESFPNIFLGFGADHNVYLLNRLTENNNSEPIQLQAGIFCIALD